jgi:hypothetical protein
MKYGSLTRAEDQRLVQILGGEDGVRAIIAANGGLNPAEAPKFGDLTRGQIGGIVTKLGKEVALKIASGELMVKIVDGVAVVGVARNPFFDHTGRGIPFPGMTGIVDANRSFYLTQLTLDYTAILARLKKHFDRKHSKFMSAEEFQARCMAVLDLVRDNPRLANLLNGPHFPWVMPQIVGDLGKLLDEVIVPALERSYREQFPERGFTNHRHKDLAGKVTVISGTNQDSLVRAMSQGPVCGVYFPAFQGFGIPADREFIQKVAEPRLVLSGMEVLVVVMMYPDVCARDLHTPGLDMAALQWGSFGYSLSFGAFDGDAGFSYRNLDAHGSCAGGVSVLG